MMLGQQPAMQQGFSLVAPALGVSGSPTADESLFILKGGDARSLHQLTPIESQFYSNLFNVADQSRTGYLSASEGAEFLARSGLAVEVLHDIWSLADPNDLGRLYSNEFGIACRLVAHAQNGTQPSVQCMREVPPSLAYFNMQPGFVPDLQSISAATPPIGAIAPSLPDSIVFHSDNPASLSTQDPTLMLFNRPAPAGDPQAVVPLPVEQDIVNYKDAFLACDKFGIGFIDGEQGRIILEKSGLSAEELYDIWNLADRDNDGRLSFGEFVVGMHLTTLRKEGFPIPQFLHPAYNNIFSLQLDNVGSAPSLPLSSGGLPNITDNNNLTSIGNLPTPSASQAVAAPDDWADAPTAATLGDVFGSFSFDPPAAGDDNSRQAARKTSSDTSRSGKVLSFGDDGSFEKGRSKRTTIREPSFGDRVRTEATKHIDDQGADVIGDVQEAAKLSAFKSSRLRELPKSEVSEKLIEERFQTFESSLEELMEYILNRFARDSSPDDEDIRLLTMTNEKLKLSVMESRKQVVEQIQRKADFQLELESVRYEYEMLKEERRLLDVERVECKKDVDALQNIILMYEQETEATKNDIQRIIDSNNWLKRTLDNAKQQTKSLDLTRKNVIAKIEAERESLKKIEEEVADLKLKTRRLRREKETLLSEHSLLEESVQQADQDRNVMISAVETGRGKLNALRMQRMLRLEEKQKLVETNALLQQMWTTNTHQQQPNNNTIGAASVTSNGMTAKALYRDPKGIPNTIPVMECDIPSSLVKYGNDLSKVGNIVSSSQGDLKTWMAFKKEKELQRQQEERRKALEQLDFSEPPLQKQSGPSLFYGEGQDLTDPEDSLDGDPGLSTLRPPSKAVVRRLDVPRNPSHPQSRLSNLKFTAGLGKFTEDKPVGSRTPNSAAGSEENQSATRMEWHSATRQSPEDQTTTVKEDTAVFDDIEHLW